MNPNDPAEITVWRGSPSQWTNLGTYLFCSLLMASVAAGYLLVPALQAYPAALAIILLPALWMLARWIATRCVRYEVTRQRVKVTTGLLSRHTSELELYRVRDYSVIEPFWLRLVGCGHVVLTTSDRTTPQVTLRAVSGAAALKDEIRRYTEQMRQRRGVRDLEVDSPPPP